jgi:kumamolisin
MVGMTDFELVPFGASERAALAGAETVADVLGSERIQATLVLRRRAELPEELASGRRTLGTRELAERYGADPDDVARVRAALARGGIEVAALDSGSRLITVEASAERLMEFFGTTLVGVRAPNPHGPGYVRHRQRAGSLNLPTEIAETLLGVLGLDDRPQARAHFRLAPSDAASEDTFAVPDLAGVYGFPPATDGSGQTVAVVELGGGYTTDDLEKYFSRIGVPTPSVRSVSVSGVGNSPSGDPQGADGEVQLDIETIGALAPGAEQVVYFAPNTDQGFLQAISQAVHADPAPTALSISWGQPEDEYTEQSRQSFDAAFADAAALGVTVCAAAGDGGSSDGASDGRPHADFPASSPHVLGCGGTTLTVDASGSVSSEVVWNHQPSGGATGGGLSAVFDLPGYQQHLGVPARPGGGTGRGVPDVAAVADPSTGYQVVVDGKPATVGGTSAVSPLWAALIARLAQSVGEGLGLLASSLYEGVAAGAVAPGFRDITSGSNGDYTAGPGWDACTGLGVPVGHALLGRLTGKTASG